LDNSTRNTAKAAARRTRLSGREIAGAARDVILPKVDVV
jgi:hypothetical protein